LQQPRGGDHRASERRRSEWRTAQRALYRIARRGWSKQAKALRYRFRPATIQGGSFPGSGLRPFRDAMIVALEPAGGTTLLQPRRLRGLSRFFVDPRSRQLNGNETDEDAMRRGGVRMGSTGARIDRASQLQALVDDHVEACLRLPRKDVLDPPGVNLVRRARAPRCSGWCKLRGSLPRSSSTYRCPRWTVLRPRVPVARG
jgi:hypothetical protein